jgi:hypothetical protein
MTEIEPSPGSLSTRQWIQLACAAALTTGVAHHYHGKPEEWSFVWTIDMLLIAVGGIVGLVTLLRHPPTPPER